MDVRVGLYKKSWVLKNWCFWMCWWRRLLRVPWTARRSNQSMLEEISPEYSLEGRMLKLKLQYFGHLMRRTDSFEESLMLGKIEGGRRRGWQRIRWLDGITDSMDVFEQAPGAGDGQGSLVCCGSWGGKELDMTEWLNWAEASVGWVKHSRSQGCLFSQNVSLNLSEFGKGRL